MHTHAGARFLISKRQQGFTILELVVVIIVMGLLAVVVMMGDTPLTSSRRVNADALQSAIRYAQSRSMKTNQVWGIAWTGTTYWLFDGGNAAAGNAAPIPGENALVVNLTTRNMTLASTIGTNILSFDIAGRPCSDQGAATLLNADQTMTLTATDDNTVSVTFTITEETGYLQ